MKYLASFFIILYLFAPLTVLAGLNTTSADFEDASERSFLTADSADISVTGDFTIEAWMKPETNSGLSCVVARWDYTNNRRTYRICQFDSVGGQLELCTSADGANGSCSGINYANWTGSWKHMAAVYTAASSGWELFIDGSSIGTNTGLTASIQDNASNLLVGAEGFDTSDDDSWYDGLLDDIRIYNTVRTGAAIAADYQTQLNGNETGLKAYWMLNNGAGACATTQLEDKGESTDPAGSQSNDLTNNNSVQCATDVPFVGSAGGGGAVIPRRRTNIFIIQ